MFVAYNYYSITYITLHCRSHLLSRKNRQYFTSETRRSIAASKHFITLSFSLWVHKASPSICRIKYSYENNIS